MNPASTLAELARAASGKRQRVDEPVSGSSCPARLGGAATGLQAQLSTALARDFGAGPPVTESEQGKPSHQSDPYFALEAGQVSPSLNPMQAKSTLHWSDCSAFYSCLQTVQSPCCPLCWGRKGHAFCVVLYLHLLLTKRAAFAPSVSSRGVCYKLSWNGRR